MNTLSSLVQPIYIYNHVRIVKVFNVWKLSTPATFLYSEVILLMFSWHTMACHRPLCSGSTVHHVQLCTYTAYGVVTCQEMSSFLSIITKARHEICCRQYNIVATIMYVWYYRIPCAQISLIRHIHHTLLSYESPEFIDLSFGNRKQEQFLKCGRHKSSIHDFWGIAIK